MNPAPHLRITEAARPDVLVPGGGRRSAGILTLLIGIVVIAAVTTAIVIWVKHREHPAQAPGGPGGWGGGRGHMGGGGGNGGMPVPVIADKAVVGSIPIMIDGLGTVTPLATVTVRTQIAGTLISLAFSEGQLVKQGDPLAQIDDRPYQLALLQAKGQLERDNALLADAKLDLARYATLVSQESVSRQQYDSQQALVHQYDGAVATDQALIKVSELNIAYCGITAPVSGRVGLRQVDTGNYVQTGDANGLVVITQLQPISVIFTVPEDNLPPVDAKLRAHEELKVMALSRDQSTRLAHGTLASIDNMIDTTTGSVKMRAMFDNDDLGLFPNQFVNVRLLVDTLQGATVVPTSAIQRGADGTFVYVVQGDSTVLITPVKLGPSYQENVAITSGVAPGDQVVLQGADQLKDKMKVIVSGPTTPENAGQGGKAGHRHGGKAAGGGTGGGGSQWRVTEAGADAGGEEAGGQTATGAAIGGASASGPAVEGHHHHHRPEADTQPQH